MRHEGRDAARPTITHWQVDDQVKLLPCQETSQVIQLSTRRVDIFERPLNGLHLNTK